MDDCNQVVKMVWRSHVVGLGMLYLCISTDLLQATLIVRFSRFLSAGKAQRACEAKFCQDHNINVSCHYKFLQNSNPAGCRREAGGWRLGADSCLAVLQGAACAALASVALASTPLDVAQASTLERWHPFYFWL